MNKTRIASVFAALIAVAVLTQVHFGHHSTSNDLRLNRPAVATTPTASPSPVPVAIHGKIITVVPGPTSAAGQDTVVMTFTANGPSGGGENERRNDGTILNFYAPAPSGFPAGASATCTITSP